MSAVNSLYGWRCSFDTSRSAAAGPSLEVRLSVPSLDTVLVVQPHEHALLPALEEGHVPLAAPCALPTKLVIGAVDGSASFRATGANTEAGLETIRVSVVRGGEDVGNLNAVGKPKYYGVRGGKNPGVYTDWASAEQAIYAQKPKVRCFSTREEAEAFANSGGVVGGAPPSAVDRKRPGRAGAGTGKTITNSASEVDSRPPAPKKRKSVGGDNDIQEVAAFGAALLGTHYAEPTHPYGNYEAPHLSELPSGDRQDESDEDDDDDDGGEDSDGDSSVATATEIKPKPRVIAKKSSVLRIYTDGSSLNNGSASARGGIGVWFGDEDSRNISEPLTGRQTNQSAELTAILRAIDIAPMHRDVAIFTGSQYSIKCVTVWHINWVKSGWRNSKGGPVENQDVIKDILKRMKEREDHGSKTVFEWVKGYTGRNDGNSQADKLATEGVRMERVAFDRR